MSKIALCLACLVVACHGRRVQTVSDEAPHSLKKLAALLQSFESPMNFGQGSHKASKATASKAPSVGRRALLGAGLATAGATLLSSQPAYSYPDTLEFMEDPRNIRYGQGFPADFFDASKGFKETESGLIQKTVVAGSGSKPSKGQNVEVIFDGYLANGNHIGFPGKRPLKFDVGLGRVPKGWDEALLDMKVGERRVLKMPPALAYGKIGLNPTVPPDSTCVYYLELKKINS